MYCDEMLTPFRGKCPFRQYIPSKPARYGIKIWWLCDSQTFYPYDGKVYCGRNSNERREIGQAKRVVLQLARPLFNSGRNSLQSFWQLEDVLNIPLCLDTENASMISHIPKQGKCVLLLSSSHFDQAVSSTPPHKPQMILDYNAERGGVDVMDGMVSHCTVRRATRRWPVRLFMTMIDVGALAGFVLYNALFETVARGNQDRFLYLLNVSEELMKMCMSYRRLHKNIPETARLTRFRQSFSVNFSATGL